jgi:hypothetical protein
MEPEWLYSLVILHMPPPHFREFLRTGLVLSCSEHIYLNGW